MLSIHFNQNLDSIRQFADYIYEKYSSGEEYLEIGAIEVDLTPSSGKREF